MKCHMRIARPVNDLAATQKLYCEGLNMQVLGHFTDHEGFDGVMIGVPSMQYHFEFTRCRHHHVAPTSTPEDLVVFYEPDSAKWTEMCDQIISAGFTKVESFNPYWDAHGSTFQDIDGYRVVIQNDEWPNAA